MLVKIHRGSRLVIAICDSDLIGKRFEEEIDGKGVQIDLTGGFFKGEEKTDEEVRDIIVDGDLEDACFNVVGENSVRLAKELGVVKDEGIMEIDGVPVGLVLL